MSNGELVPGNLQGLLEVAEQLAKAEGLIPRALDTPGKILAVILAGHERGIPPMTSLQHLNVIEGKVGMSAEMMLAQLIKAGVRHEWIKDVEGVEVELKLSREGFAPMQKSLTMSYCHEQKWDQTEIKTWNRDENRKVGTGKFYLKENWQKYPGAMLRARLISIMARAFAPDAGCGYSPEEMEEIRGEVKGVAAIEKPNGKKSASKGDEVRLADAMALPQPPAAQPKAQEDPAEALGSTPTPSRGSQVLEALEAAGKPPSPADEAFDHWRKRIVKCETADELKQVGAEMGDEAKAVLGPKNVALLREAWKVRDAALRYELF